jgi:phytoene/squalene synthetase
MSQDASGTLARSITKGGSKQTYFIARLMVDKDLINDFMRAYAYFRWADDIVDAPASTSKRIPFIKRQRELIDRLYRDDRPVDLAPEERVVADLIARDRGEKSGLQSFIRNMLSVIEFDAQRKGLLISQNELTRYSNWLSRSVTDGLQYFIKNGHPYPLTEERYLAATAAHITHLLRDMLQDTANGFINIPREYLEAHDIGPEDVDSPPFRAWVRGQVELARRYFREGKRYLDGLAVLRCKIVGYWYCARFEVVLDTIERDDYTLRPLYNSRQKCSTWLKIAWLGISVTLRHLLRRVPDKTLETPELNAPNGSRNPEKRPSNN